MVSAGKCVTSGKDNKRRTVDGGESESFMTVRQKDGRLIVFLIYLAFFTFVMCIVGV